MEEQGTTAELPGEDVPSPCIGVCAIDAISGLCRGCLRSVSEIGAWRDAGPASRRLILRRIDLRLASGLLPAPRPPAAPRG